MFIRNAPWVTAILLLLAPMTAEAKDLYVSPSGNDSVTWADNSSARPWATLLRATALAQAGDVVHVAAGTYQTAGSNSRATPAYNPANSGTAGAPIVFVAEGVVNLTLTPGTAGAVIGANSRNYITWRGPFTIWEGSAPSRSDTGPVAVWFCNGCVLEGLDINAGGSAESSTRGDNHNAIRIEWSTNITVRNNRLRGVRGNHNPNNAAAIMTYDAGRLTIVNNEIFDSSAGIFLKGNDDPTTTFGNTIAYNYLHDGGTVDSLGNPVGGAIVLHINPSNEPTKIYQNIVSNWAQCWRQWGLVPDSQIAQMKTVRMVNNTFVGCEKGLSLGNNPIAGSDHMAANNIFANMRAFAIYTLSGVETFEPSRWRWTNNLYWNNPMHADINAESSVDRARLNSFADWRTRFPAFDAGGASVDPQFVSSTDFHLRSTSPARTLGRDVLDLNGNGSTTDVVPAGAYITGNEVIGRTTGLPTTGPSTPTGLRITGS